MKKLLTALSILLIATASYAETITLTSGKVIEGEIVERTNELIKLDTGVGVITTYYLDEVDKVGVNNSQVQPIIQKGNNSASEVKGDEIRKEFYPNGSVHYERGYKNGEKHGLAKEFNESGNVIREVMYVNGKMHGEFKVYYSSGVLKNLKVYVDELIEGVTKQYNEDGKLTAELTRDRGEMGWWKTKSYDYYPNGNLKYEYLYNQKTREGYRKDFHENGQISLEFNIKAGQFLDCKNYNEEVIETQLSTTDSFLAHSFNVNTPIDRTINSD